MRSHLLNKTALGLKTTALAFVCGSFLSTTLPLEQARAQDSSASQISSSNSLAGNYLAARIAARDKDTESAAHFFRKALELDTGNQGLKLQSFLNFISNGDFAEGVELGNEIVKDENAPEIVGLILAVEDLRKKSWANAERRLETPWRSALDRLIAGLTSAWVKVGQNQFEDALKTVDDLNGPAWFDLFVQYHGGLVALEGGDIEGAIKRLETAHANRAGGQAANETYVRVISALAHAYWKSGMKEQTQALLTDGLNRAPQNPIFEHMKANVDADKAPGFSIASAQHGAAEVFLNLGTAIDKDGGEQFARIYLQLATSLAPNSPAITMRLAELFDKQGKAARANTLFEQIPQSSPLYRIARLEIALNLDELEQKEAAIKELDSIIAARPDDLVAHLSYGAVLARRENYKDAITVYQKILDRIEKPQRFHWNLFYRQGIAYERTNQWPKAEARFKEALALFPDQPSVLNYLGYSWVDQNTNLQEGLDMIRKAVELRPNDGYMVDSLGWAYYRLGSYDEAVVELERAVELRPGDPTINDHLGDAYWKANRKLEATFQWQHALALDPPEGDIARIEDKLENGLDSVEAKEAKAKKEDPDEG